MSKKTNSTVIMKSIGVAIVVTQLLDIIIHAATNQLEPLRVTSNIIILAWLAIVVSGKFHDKSQLIAVASIAAYFILNIVFLSLEGVTNAEQGEELRITLFLLMFTTMALSSWLTYIRRDIFSTHN